MEKNKEEKIEEFGKKFGEEVVKSVDGRKDAEGRQHQEAVHNERQILPRNSKSKHKVIPELAHVVKDVNPSIVGKRSSRKHY